jgi:hypothetical protein
VDGALVPTESKFRKCAFDRDDLSAEPMQGNVRSRTRELAQSFWSQNIPHGF